MNGIGRRIDECIAKLKLGDGENAFIQLSIAIDATSKLNYPKIKGSSKRNKLFIKENLPFVLWSLTNGTPNKSSSLFFVIDDEGKEISLEDIMYRLLRCTLLHEGDLPDLVIFTQEEFIANKKDKIILPLAIISSFCLAVIKNPFNKKEKLINNNLFIPYGSNIPYDLNQCWGNEDRLRSIVRKGFLYDVEKELEKINKHAINH